MEKRRLGTSGLEVSAMGLGCMGMSQYYGTPEERDERESIATIHRAIELGVTLFDTAEVYGPYVNEELLARALKGQRDRVVIATKFGFRFDEKGGIAGLDSRPAHIREAVEGSLRRLHVEIRSESARPASLTNGPRRCSSHQHCVDPTSRIEDVIGAMAELVRAGRCVSSAFPGAGERTIRRAHAVHPIAALSERVFALERNLEPRIIPLLRELGIGLVPFRAARQRIPHRNRHDREPAEGVPSRAQARLPAPTIDAIHQCVPTLPRLCGGDARAMRTVPVDGPDGDVEQQRDRVVPRYQGENFDANMRAASAVHQLSVQKCVTAGQIALAWLLHKGPDIVPIPGTKRRRYLEENVAAVSVSLSAAEMTALDAALSPDRVAGPRYNAKQMSQVDR